MPFLIDIGPNPRNKAGVSSRGYWIRRRGSIVRRQWGPVDVEGIRGGHFYWRRGSQHKIDMFATNAEAEAFFSEKLRAKKAQAANPYRQLPSGQKIRARPRATASMPPYKPR